MSRRSGSEVVTIFWRDIPVQVNGRSGRERHQVLLSAKFQRAVDRAKRKAGIVTADEDVAQWRREAVGLDGAGDVAEAADRRAAELEQRFSRELLGRLAFVGGRLADMDESAPSSEELNALEELDTDQPSHHQTPAASAGEETT